MAAGKLLKIEVPKKQKTLTAKLQFCFRQFDRGKTISCDLLLTVYR